MMTHTPETRVSGLPKYSLTKWLTAVLTAVVLTTSVWAADPDEVYLGIHRIITQADLLNSTSQADAARVKYQQAQGELLNFKRNFPTWNQKIVAYRLNYLAQRLETPAQAAESAGTSAGTTTTRAKAAPAASASAHQTKLLEAGAEPRQVLRLHAEAGTKQTVSMTVEVAMDFQVGPTSPPQAIKLPRMQMGMDFTVKDVAANGDMQYETVITDATVAEDPGANPQLIEPMKASMAAIKGLTGTGIITDRGVTKTNEVKIPNEVDPQAKQSVDQIKEAMGDLSTPFPEEAVGPGAKWEVKRTVKAQGVTMNQTTTCQLVSVEGDRLTIKTALVQGAANQKIPNPLMPTAKVDLSKMTITGNSEATLDLAHILPHTMTGTGKSESLMSMGTGAQKQNLTMKTDTAIRVESK
jgi:hypothetical protein